MTDIEKGGRPLQLTPEAEHTFYTAIKLGLPVVTACQLINVSSHTYYAWRLKGIKWQENGEKDSDPLKVYGHFLRSIEQARAEYILNDVKNINKSKKKDWKAAAWSLEKTAPEEFSPGQNILVTHEDKKVYQITWGDEKPKLNDGLTIDGEIVNEE